MVPLTGVVPSTWCPPDVGGFHGGGGPRVLGGSPDVMVPKI